MQRLKSHKRTGAKISRENLCRVHWKLVNERLFFVGSVEVEFLLYAHRNQSISQGAGHIIPTPANQSLVYGTNNMVTN
jgi:hypothetical protein